MPGFPGAQWSSVKPGLRASFHASACSRPPDPTRSTFTTRVYCGSEVRAGDLRRRRADDDRDLVKVLQHEGGRVACVGLAVLVDGDVHPGAAVAADALLVQANVPLGEHLAERVGT